MDKSIILIDGSYLFSAFTTMRRKDASLKDHFLNINSLTNTLLTHWHPYIGETIRMVFYFKKQDTRIRDLLIIPNINIPGTKNHWRIIECGEPVTSIPDEELQKLSTKYRDIYPRAEKGLDMRIACDVLTAAAMGRISNIVFMIDDRDYIPLIESLQRFGCCTYLTTIDGHPPSEKLLEVCDHYLDLSQSKNSFCQVKNL